MSELVRVTRQNPMLVVVLLDQSDSMKLESDEPGLSRAEMAAEKLNALLQTIGVQCTTDPTLPPFDYYYVAVVGYGATIASALPDRFGSELVLPISKLIAEPDFETRFHPERNVDVKVPIWVTPQFGGETPMTAAFKRASGVTAAWVAEHGTSLPPTVVNITDGMVTDGDPREVCQRMRTHVSDHGSITIFNVHINPNATTVMFPPEPPTIPGADADTMHYAHMLFEMSSEIPPHQRQIAAEHFNLSLAPGARGFVFNGDAHSLITALNIGSLVRGEKYG